MSYTASLPQNSYTPTDAASIVAYLKGTWHGTYGTAPCPICQPEGRKDQTALSAKDGSDRLLLLCRKLGCNFADILAAIGTSATDYKPPDPSIIAQRDREATKQRERLAGAAQRLWMGSLPISGTIAEDYLAGARGISAPLPDTLRFNRHCRHSPSNSTHPALIGAVTRLDGAAKPCVHRTYISCDGSNKADLEPAKMMLGKALGGGVVLKDEAGPLAVGEGIETSLSLASGLLKDIGTLVAALSAAGMAGLALPEVPANLIIATDGDEAGQNAGDQLGTRALSLGWNVQMICAPEGQDFNDVLRGVTE